MLAAGNPANSSDDPEVPASASPARPDISTAGILWYLTGSRSAQQVRVVGAVPSCSAAGTQAAAREMAQGGQGLFLQAVWWNKLWMP